MLITAKFWCAIILFASHHYCKWWEKMTNSPNGKTVIVDDYRTYVQINRKIDGRVRL